MLPVALGGVGQEQLNNNFPPPKKFEAPAQIPSGLYGINSAQAGGPRRKALRTSYGARKRRIFVYPVAS